MRWRTRDEKKYQSVSGAMRAFVAASWREPNPNLSLFFYFFFFASRGAEGWDGASHHHYCMGMGIESGAEL